MSARSFPSIEVFRTLPWCSQILHGLLGADLVGFHTFSYMRHLVSSLLHVEGVEPDIDRVRVGERDVNLGVFPMGIDAARFNELSQDPQVVAQVAVIREDAGGRRILLGVDRLDYTKGIPRRLHAIERLLARNPDLGDRVRYVQVAVPSRAEVDSYQLFKRQVEEAVGRINGARGTLRSVPVHYMHRSITPAELDGAVVVNPYDVDGVADAIQRALFMAQTERTPRMASLRRQVMTHDVHAWATSFLDRLAAARPQTLAGESAPQPPLATVLSRGAGALRLLLDYDGTLTPIVRDPELAAPDEDLLRVLGALAATPGIRLDIVSGRTRDTLERWLGDLPATLWAEHGFWRRPAAGAAWSAAAPIPSALMERTRPILEQFTASTPGSHIEAKSASIAWHYRRAQSAFGARQAHELRMVLGDALSNQPLEVLEGKKVIEIRLRGVSKAIVGRRVEEETAGDTLIVAIGDDRTDEHLFAALPPGAVTIAVGPVPGGARFRVDDYRAVRQILRTLVDQNSARPAQPTASVASVSGKPRRK